MFYSKLTLNPSVRVEFANDTESKRVKFVLVIWIGEGTKVMRKARLSIESGEVKRVLGHHSIQVDARDKGDLVEKEIVVRLRKAGGADYNGGRGQSYLRVNETQGALMGA